MEDPNDPGRARRGATDPSAARLQVLRQVSTTPLVSCPELARVLDLDEAAVTETLRALRKEGLLRSVSFGCLHRRTPRYWVNAANADATLWSDSEQAGLSWHTDHGIGSLLKYDLPRVESINQVAARYVDDGWALVGVAWVERDAVQAVALYIWKEAPAIRSVVYFVWVARWDTEREIWERLTDLPEAARRITHPGLPGSVALVGPDRWAVARALPMAVERLGASQVRPADVAAWTHAEGWQAASGASMLDGAGQPFRPTLAPVQLDRFVWPRSRRSLGRTTLDTIISSCIWTRRDSCTLYRTLMLLAQYGGASVAHLAALAGKLDKDPITPKRMGTLLEMGFAREACIAGVANLGTREKPEAFSARGRWQMRFRLSLGPKGEGEPQERQPGESKEDYARRRANGAFLLMLAHGELSYREIVRRSWLGRLADRFGDRLVHEDVLVDLLGRHTVLGYGAVPASRARTVNALGEGIDPDGMLYCCSPVGTGYHYFELELSHLSPKAIRRRIEKYAQRLTSYPLAVVCRTDLGAWHYGRIGRELGVPVVATSIRRLREKGFSGPVWFHHGQEVSVTPVPCPPRPATPPSHPPAS